MFINQVKYHIQYFNSWQTSVETGLFRCIYIHLAIIHRTCLSAISFFNYLGPVVTFKIRILLTCNSCLNALITSMPTAYLYNITVNIFQVNRVITITAISVCKTVSAFTNCFEVSLVNLFSVNKADTTLASSRFRFLPATLSYRADTRGFVAPSPYPSCNVGIHEGLVRRCKYDFSPEIKGKYS